MVFQSNGGGGYQGERGDGGESGAVAILSLNDGPPRSFLQGEKVGPGVKLVAVEGNGVVIEQGGERVRLGVERLGEGVVLPRLVRP